MFNNKVLIFGNLIVLSILYKFYKNNNDRKNKLIDNLIAKYKDLKYNNDLNVIKYSLLKNQLLVLQNEKKFDINNNEKKFDIIKEKKFDIINNEQINNISKELIDEVIEKINDNVFYDSVNI